MSSSQGEYSYYLFSVVFIVTVLAFSCSKVFQFVQLIIIIKRNLVLVKN